jgi:hypothetical protein
MLELHYRDTLTSLAHLFITCTKVASNQKQFVRPVNSQVCTTAWRVLLRPFAALRKELFDEVLEHGTVGGALEDA